MATAGPVASVPVRSDATGRSRESSHPIRHSMTARGPIAAAPIRDDVVDRHGGFRRRGKDNNEEPKGFHDCMMAKQGRQEVSWCKKAFRLKGVRQKEAARRCWMVSCQPIQLRTVIQHWQSAKASASWWELQFSKSFHCFFVTGSQVMPRQRPAAKAWVITCWKNASRWRSPPRYRPCTEGTVFLSIRGRQRPCHRRTWGRFANHALNPLCRTPSSRCRCNSRNSRSCP